MLGALAAKLAEQRCDATDIAGALFFLPLGSTTRADRLRLVRAASGGVRGEELRRAARAVDRALRRLRRRAGRDQPHADISFPVRRALEPSVYARLLSGAGMEVLRTLPDRENRRFDGPGGERYFMKRYPASGRSVAPAAREREAIDLFERSGVPVCAAEAFGNEPGTGSFLVVRGCRGEPLDDLLRAGVTPAERRALCVQTARLFGRMRRLGLRHRDAYPCHVFVARDGDRLELRLIDMTRAGRAPFPRGRWFVKDASQLWHGAPRPPVTRTDAVRWLRAYFDVPRLTPEAKRFARQVAEKERRIAARQERKARERERA